MTGSLRHSLSVSHVELRRTLGSAGANAHLARERLAARHALDAAALNASHILDTLKLLETAHPELRAEIEDMRYAARDIFEGVDDFAGNLPLSLVA